MVRIILQLILQQSHIITLKNNLRTCEINSFKKTVENIAASCIYYLTCICALRTERSEKYTPYFYSRL
jgi:hypothetical protein